MTPQKSITAIALVLLAFYANGQNKAIKVIGYFSGKADQVESIPAKKLSHIIYSFCHLQGNRLAVDSLTDSALVEDLGVGVALTVELPADAGATAGRQRGCSLEHNRITPIGGWCDVDVLRGVLQRQHQ